MALDPKQRRASRHAPPAAPAEQQQPSRLPLTVERITDAALAVVADRGYDALTMRSVAGLLGTGPASLYAHVVNKADIDELVMGRLCAAITLPEPDAARWREQITDVFTQFRDQYLAYPGIARAATAMGVTNLDVLRVNEGMLAILLAGGIRPQPAAWAIDALFLYVGAYALESSVVAERRHSRDDATSGRGDPHDVRERFAALPADTFPNIRRHASELTSGGGHERFDFTLGMIINNL